MVVAGKELVQCSISEAKKLVNKVCAISWRDRRGSENRTVSRIQRVAYTAGYGAYLVLDYDDEIMLERVTEINVLDDISH
jgi:hypothetical protein